MQTEIPLLLVIAVVSVALFIGAAMIATVTFKYAIHQWFHAIGGPTLTLFGVALIGLTVYGNVTLKAGDFQAELRTLRASLESSQHHVAELQRVNAEAAAQLELAQAAVNDAGDFITSGISTGVISQAGSRELVGKFKEAQKKLLLLDNSLKPDMRILDRDLEGTKFKYQPGS
ncbi:MAG: hypothetical protein GEU89_12980 [Kiloniellaceae bacterium]|nr:hypothetical protein [Kiloniellaceae bacterium]